MKLSSLSGVVVFCAAAVFFAAQPSGQTAASNETITLMGCLQGDGSDAAPWVLSRAALPVPPPEAPAGRGGRGGRGGGRGAPPPPPPDPELVDLTLVGIDLTPFQGTRIAADGMLGPDMRGKGRREFRITAARTVWGAHRCN